MPPGVEAWNTYRSDGYGYALRYPPTWFSFGNFGAPGTEAYFSNHQDAGSPMNLGTDGIFVDLSADCQYWLGPDTKLVSKSYVTIGSTSVPRYVVFDATPDGAFYAADADVSANASCYRLTMIGSLSAVQTNLSTYDLMLSSLRFSARTAPIASPHPTSQPSQSS